MLPVAALFRQKNRWINRVPVSDGKYCLPDPILAGPLVRLLSPSRPASLIGDDLVHGIPQPPVPAILAATADSSAATRSLGPMPAGFQAAIGHQPRQHASHAAEPRPRHHCHLTPRMFVLATVREAGEPNPASQAGRSHPCWPKLVAPVWLAAH